eukprot:5246791-Prymnesium_polylepis.1
MAGGARGLRQPSRGQVRLLCRAAARPPRGAVGRGGRAVGGLLRAGERGDRRGVRHGGAPRR